MKNCQTLETIHTHTRILLNEKGSIVIYVIVSLIFLTIVLISMLAASKNSLITALKAQETIKNTYENDVANADKIYENKVEKKVTVTYASNGGIGTMDVSRFGKNKTSKLKANAFEKLGYEFDGWKDQDNNTYTDEQTVTFENDVTLTAQWKIATYTITLNNEGATTPGTTQIYEKYGIQYSLSSNGNAMTSIIIPTKTNLYFIGYYTGENGTGTQYIDSNGYLTSYASNTHFTSNGTLYAYWRTLPTEYQKVEYVESTGTQYIDTGFCPNQDTRWVVDANIKYHEKECNVMGCRTNTLKFYFAKFCSYNNNNFAIAYGKEETGSTSSSPYPYSYLYNSKHLFDFNKNNLYVDGNLLLQTPQSSGFSIPYSIYIFAMHDAYSGTPTVTCYTHAKLYSSQIYDNGTLVRDFIPCRTKTVVIDVEGNTCPKDTIGLYDTVNNDFYSPKGGTLTAGSDVN